ncbi:hypothetical protein FKR81_42840, partial [Lentzea tibetensis]
MSGPLQPFADGFHEALQRQGFSPWSVMFDLQSMQRLSCWLLVCQLDPAELTAGEVGRFVQEYRGSRPDGRRRPRGLSSPLCYLRALGVVPDAVVAVSDDPLGGLLDEFAPWEAQLGVNCGWVGFRLVGVRVCVGVVVLPGGVVAAGRRGIGVVVTSGFGQTSGVVGGSGWVAGGVVVAGVRLECVPGGRGRVVEAASGTVLFEGVLSEDGPRLRLDRGDGSYRVYGRDGVLREEQFIVELGGAGSGGLGSGGVLSGSARLTYPTASSGHTFRTRTRTRNALEGTDASAASGGPAKLTVGGRSVQLQWQPVESDGLVLENQQKELRLAFDHHGRLASGQIGISVGGRKMTITAQRESDGNFRYAVQQPDGQKPGSGQVPAGYEVVPFRAGWKVTTRGGMFDGQPCVFDFLGYGHPHGQEPDLSVRARRTSLPVLTSRYAQHIQPAEPEEQKLLQVMFPTTRDSDGREVPVTHPPMDQFSAPDIWHGMINTAEVLDEEDNDLGLRSEPARQINCALTALALNEAWFGNPQVAPIWKPMTDIDGDDDWVVDTVMQEYAGHYWTREPGTGPGSLDSVEQKLRALGPGSAAIIGFTWTLRGTPTAHAMNILNDRGTLVYSDAQVTEPIAHRPEKIASVTSFVFDPAGNPVLYHPLTPGAPTTAQRTTTQEHSTTQEQTTTPAIPVVDMHDVTPSPIATLAPVTTPATESGVLPGFIDTPADGLCLITSVLWSMTPQARTAVYLHLQTHSRIHPISRLAR